MSRKEKRDKAIAEMMPDEINAVKQLVREFMEKINNTDNEIELLKEDRKEIIEEYSEKLDMKTLQIALRVIKLQDSVARQDAFDLFMEALSKPST